MRTQLTDFAADFMADAEVEQRLKRGIRKAHGNCPGIKRGRKL